MTLMSEITWVHSRSVPKKFQSQKDGLVVLYMLGSNGNPRAVDVFTGAQNDLDKLEMSLGETFASITPTSLGDLFMGTIRDLQKIIPQMILIIEQRDFKSIASVLPALSDKLEALEVAFSDHSNNGQVIAKVLAARKCRLNDAYDMGKNLLEVYTIGRKFQITMDGLSTGDYTTIPTYIDNVIGAMKELEKKLESEYNTCHKSKKGSQKKMEKALNQVSKTAPKQARMQKEDGQITAKKGAGAVTVGTQQVKQIQAKDKAIAEIQTNKGKAMTPIENKSPETEEAANNSDNETAVPAENGSNNVGKEIDDEEE